MSEELVVEVNEEVDAEAKAEIGVENIKYISSEVKPEGEYKLDAKTLALFSGFGGQFFDTIKLFLATWLTGVLVFSFLCIITIIFLVWVGKRSKKSSLDGGMFSIDTATAYRK